MSYPVFLINLAHHTQKRAFMDAQFAALGLELERIDAALGADPEVRARADVAPYATLSAGEIGCFESHRRFWSQVVERDLPGAFVVEDDIVVASDFGDLRFPDTVLATADVIKIDQGVRNVGHYGTAGTPISESRQLFRLLGPEFSTGCYFVTRAGAKKLLDLTARYFEPVDRVMFDQDNKTFWALTIWKLAPSAAVQMRLFDPESEQETELGDSISANRLSGREAVPVITRLKRLGMQWRRLRDWDMRGVRKARIEQRMAAFRQQEATEQREIAFETASAEHVTAAQQAFTS